MERHNYKNKFTMTPFIVYYWEPYMGDRNCFVYAGKTGSEQEAKRYMKYAGYDYDRDADFDVYPLAPIEDSRGNEYSITIAKAKSV